MGVLAPRRGVGERLTPYSFDRPNTRRPSETLLFPEGDGGNDLRRNSIPEGRKIAEGPTDLRLYDESALRFLQSGRHKLTREQVSGSQRLRLLEAVIEAVGQRGYDATSVADVIERAGVSRRTFYDHFASKEACFIESYEKHAEMIFEITVLGGASAEGWAPATLAALEAFLGFFVDHPLVAKVYAVDAYSTNEAILEQQYRGDARFVQLFEALDEAVRLEVPSKPPMGEYTIWILIGGMIELLRRKTRTDGAARLLEVAPAMFNATTELLFAPKAPPRLPASVRARLEELSAS